MLHSLNIAGKNGKSFGSVQMTNRLIVGYAIMLFNDINNSPNDNKIILIKKLYLTAKTKKKKRF